MIERRALLKVADGVEHIEARRHRPVEKIRFGEAEIDGLALGRDAEGEPEVLAAAQKVALADGDVGDHRLGGGKAGAEAQLASRLLLHVHLDHGLVAGAALLVGDVDLLEEAEAANSGPRAPELRGIEGIALDQAKLAADNLVQGANVAGDVDPLDVDPRTLIDLIAERYDAIFPIAIDPRADVDERIAQPTELEGHIFDSLLDQLGVVGVVLEGRRQSSQLFRVEVLELGFQRDLAERVDLTLVQREGDEEILAIRGQLGERRDHAKVGVAAGQIVFPQKLTVQGQAIGIVGIVRGQKPVPARFLGGDGAAQAAVGERRVADEPNFANFGYRTLVDLEHQIDAILRQLYDLRLDGRGKPAAAAVNFDQALHVVLHARPGVDDARAELHLRLQHLVVDPPVALEGEPIDDRVFDDRDDQQVDLAADLDVREKAGGEQILQRFVDLARVEPVADPDGHVRADRLRFDPLVALDLDFGDQAEGLRERRRRHR